MATIKELLDKRDFLQLDLSQIEYSLIDFKENPDPATDVENLKYQVGFVIKQIEKINDQVNIALKKQTSFYREREKEYFKLQHFTYTD